MINVNLHNLDSKLSAKIYIAYLPKPCFCLENSGLSLFKALLAIPILTLDVDYIVLAAMGRKGWVREAPLPILDVQCTLDIATGLRHGG